MRKHAAIFTLGCVFLAGCQSAHSTPAPTSKPVTVTVTTTATHTVTVSATPSVSATVSTTTVTRTQEAGGSLEDSEPYDGYSYEDDYEDDYDSGVEGYYRSEPKLFMHRNPGNNNVAPKLPSQKRYNSTPNHSGGSKSSGGTGSGRSSSGGGSRGGRRR